MPLLKGCRDSGFKGTVRLRRFLTPPYIRGVLMWEYTEPYRTGTARIIHIPGIRTSWLRGRWDDMTAKDYDDHERIQRHLLGALQGRVRGYFAGRDGRLDPAGEDFAQ
jgi:hypothetical protein